MNWKTMAAEAILPPTGLSQRMYKLILRGRLSGRLFATQWVGVAGHWTLMLHWAKDVYKFKVE